MSKPQAIGKILSRNGGILGDLNYYKSEIGKKVFLEEVAPFNGERVWGNCERSCCNGFEGEAYQIIAYIDKELEVRHREEDEKK